MNKHIRHCGLKSALAGAALFGAQAVSAALPVIQIGDRITFADGPGAYPGGAFILTDYSASSNASKGSFQSFCLEKNEYMNFGTLASGTVFKVADISTEARKGGAGGSIPTPYPHDPLDKRTAWLYTQYMENPSALNAVSGWAALTAESKGTEMQKAIWSIEQEIGAVAGVANYLIAAAAAGSQFWSDTGRVRVLNLTWLSGGDPYGLPTGSFAQDQLYITPVPEPESYAMLLAGLGLLGFVGRRRKQNEAAAA